MLMHYNLSRYNGFNLILNEKHSTLQPFNITT